MTDPVVQGDTRPKLHANRSAVKPLAARVVSNLMAIVGIRSEPTLHRIPLSG
jgi:hypothetical protein